MVAVAGCTAAAGCSDTGSGLYANILVLLVGIFSTAAIITKAFFHMTARKKRSKKPDSLKNASEPDLSGEAIEADQTSPPQLQTEPTPILWKGQVVPKPQSPRQTGLISETWAKQTFSFPLQVEPFSKTLADRNALTSPQDASAHQQIPSEPNSRPNFIGIFAPPIPFYHPHHYAKTLSGAGGGKDYSKDKDMASSKANSVFESLARIARQLDALGDAISKIKDGAVMKEMDNALTHAKSVMAKQTLEAQIISNLRVDAKSAAKDMMRGLLPMLDSLDLISGLGTKLEGRQKRGILLATSNIRAILGREGLMEMDVVGHLFNPHLHEVASFVDSPADKGTIVHVTKTGYFFKEEMLRLARVAVSMGR